MKKIAYLFSFTFLGLMVGFLVHALVEIAIIKLLVADFGKYGLGLSWADWVRIHAVATAGLLLATGYWGFRSGQRWWHVLYVERRYSKYFKRPLKPDF